MPDWIRHPIPAWIPASAGMTKPDMFNCQSNKLDGDRDPEAADRLTYLNIRRFSSIGPHLLAGGIGGAGGHSAPAQQEERPSE
jgi:hypothetical protein